MSCITQGSACLSLVTTCILTDKTDIPNQNTWAEPSWRRCCCRSQCGSCWPATWRGSAAWRGRWSPAGRSSPGWRSTTGATGNSPHICPAKLYFDLIDIIYLIGIHVTIIFRHFLACSQHKLIRNSNLKRELFNKFDISTETVNFFKSLPVHFLAWKKIFWLSNLLYPSVNQIN